MLRRILNLVGRLINTARRRDRPHRRPLLRTMSNHQFLRLGPQHLLEPVVHPRLDVNPIGTDTRLTGMPPLQQHQRIQRLIQIRVIEDNEWAIPTQLKRQLLQPFGTMPSDQLPDPSRPRERNLLDKRMLTQRLTQTGGILQIRRQHIEHPRRKPGLTRQMCQRETRQRRLGARLANHRAAGRQRCTRLPQNHRDGEIPRHERNRHTNGLLDGENTSIRRRGNGNPTLDAFRLAREPPRKSRRVVELSIRLSDGLARLVGQDLGEVFAGFADERVPF